MDLVIAHVSKDYGRGPVLRDVSLTVRQGETVCLMGPSGLGKTTLLRCVAGLETPDAGAVTGVPRRLGYVFQEDRLCDNFSAVANIRLVTGRTLPEKAILQHLKELGLSDSVRLPVSQLSGGMRRRVAIARAVCCGPELLLLDEAVDFLPNVWYNSGRNTRRCTEWVPFPTMWASGSKNTAKAGAIPSSSSRP